MTPDTFEFIDRLTAKARALGDDGAGGDPRPLRAADRDRGAGGPRLRLRAAAAAAARAVHRRGPTRLRRWLDVRPTNAVTVLDTHDGIGVIDVGADQMGERRPACSPRQDIDALVEGIHSPCRGPVAQGQRVGGIERGRLPGQLHLLRRTRLRRRRLPAGAGGPVLHPGHPAGLLRGPAGRRPTTWSSWRARASAATSTGTTTPARRSIGTSHRPGGPRAARPDPPAQHPSGVRGTFEAGGNGSSIVLTWTHGEASAVLEADLDTRTARLTATDAAGGTVTCEDLLTGTDVLRPR